MFNVDEQNPKHREILFDLTVSQSLLSLLKHCAEWGSPAQIDEIMDLANYARDRARKKMKQLDHADPRSGAK